MKRYILNDDGDITGVFDDEDLIEIPIGGHPTRLHYADAGVKGDQGKLRYSLIPWDALETVVRCLEYGEQKYPDGPDGPNWTKIEAQRYVEACQRHLAAIHRGEETDPDSGLPHLAHVIVNGLFALSLRGNK